MQENNFLINIFNLTYPQSVYFECILQMQIKVFVSWILTVVMCYHIIGYAVQFRATDLVHHSEMQQLLNKKELSVLKIPNKFLKHHPEIFMRLNDDEIFTMGIIMM